MAVNSKSSKETPMRRHTFIYTQKEKTFILVVIFNRLEWRRLHLSGQSLSQANAFTGEVRTQTGGSKWTISSSASAHLKWWTLLRINHIHLNMWTSVRLKTLANAGAHLPLCPTGRERHRKPQKETNEALCDDKKVLFSSCFALLWQTLRIYTYIHHHHSAFTSTSIIQHGSCFLFKTYNMSTDGWAFTFLSLTFGLGRSPVVGWSKGVLSSLSPRIEMRYWAMTSCCSWEQWFSNDKITG